jgi:hypothetical protein
MDHASALRKRQDVRAAGMAAGQGIDLAPTARSNLAPSPHNEGEPGEQNGGQDQGGGLGKDGYRGGGRSHFIILSGRTVL